jgi:hypothetical protein
VDCLAVLGRRAVVVQDPHGVLQRSTPRVSITTLSLIT